MPEAVGPMPEARRIPSPRRSGVPLGVTARGTGDAFVPLSGTEPLLATVSSKGASNLVVEVLTDSGSVADLLVNDIGGYSGTRLVSASGRKLGGLRISTDGAWTLELNAVTAAPVLKRGSTLRGRRDRVVRLPEATEGGVALRVRSSGTGNFIVVALAWAQPMYEVLVNEIDGFTGIVHAPEGATYLEICADGSWVIQATSDQAGRIVRRG